MQPDGVSHVISRLFSRRNKPASPASRRAFTELEHLEGRLLMKAPVKVGNAVLDNRGEAVLTLTRTVTGISKSSCKLFTAGSDGIIGNTDDVRKAAQVIYNPESF